MKAVWDWLWWDGRAAITAYLFIGICGVIATGHWRMLLFWAWYAALCLFQDARSW